ncbi:hypothetical protein BDZ85DRAFT_138796 [Elsinoe ampelina]|uniref:Uncharacterized protein n=1 Tax=Elsinoe ampelina TaxID=302913 RepID=A0A6A6G945_9PEZI|nr:hypothetical protein BDZ85DRAFT_138796 [Elsinoe ampelina]
MVQDRLTISRADFHQAISKFQALCEASKDIHWSRLQIIESHGAKGLSLSIAVERTGSIDDYGGEEDVTEADDAEAVVPTRGNSNSPMRYDIIRSESYEVPVLYIHSPRLGDFCDLMASHRDMRPETPLSYTVKPSQSNLPSQTHVCRIILGLTRLSYSSTLAVPQKQSST